VETKNFLNETIEELHPMYLIIGPTFIGVTTMASYLLKKTFLIPRILYKGVESLREEGRTSSETCAGGYHHVT
jgi:hypothetical protein